MMPNLRVKLFADGANLDDMIALSRDASIHGFTTNPTLMRKSGVTDYLEFARRVVKAIPEKPISFEVIADDVLAMELQVREWLAPLGHNVYVKIPITTTAGVDTTPMIHRLSLTGVKVNITAVMTFDQIYGAIQAVGGLAPAVVSVFAGRIADTGVDPIPFIQKACVDAAQFTNVEVLWASPREVLNVYQADRARCDIITATPDILKKLSLYGKDLAEYSRETVQMFYDDAQACGLALGV